MTSKIYKKIHKYKKKRSIKRINVNYYPKLNYSLILGAYGYLNEKQIESARRVIVRHISKIGKIFIKIIPNTPITKKATGSRMGKGKGKIKGYVFYGRPGNTLFSISNNIQIASNKGLTFSKKKLPFKTIIIK